MITRLRYGNTNTYFVRGTQGGLLIDTDYAGTLPAFYKVLKSNNISTSDITYVIATHYHPDHIGLISELMKLGIRLLCMDIQCEAIHFSDDIFRRDGYSLYEPIDETLATMITCKESRPFFHNMGIEGEIIATTSHSKDSVSIVLDNGDCMVGDLEPIEYLAAYTDNKALRKDWERIMRYHPKVIHYAHVNEKRL